MVDAHLRLYEDVLGKPGANRAVPSSDVSEPRADEPRAGGAPELASVTPLEKRRRAAG
jgi:hypothetical protein